MAQELLTAKLHTNGRYTCGSNVAVDEDHFSYSKDQKLHGKKPGVIRILEPIDSTLNYFEHKIISGGMQCAISIGLGGAGYPLDHMPGCSLSGIGYHANSGRCFCECGPGKDFSSTCTVGDKMGCGIDFRSRDSSGKVNVFFTKNGQQVGDVVRIKIPAGGLYPLIGLSSEGEQVQYLGHCHNLPLTLKVKLNTNGRITCGSNAEVNEDIFSYTRDQQVNGKSPGVVKILEPMDSTLNYLEYRIISGGLRCAVSIGVGSSNYPLDSMPGLNLNGIGYQANDGKMFYQSEQGSDFGPTCTVGDRMGCGVDFRSQDSSGQLNVFFTKNGQQVGDVVRIKIPAGGLYPLIGLSSEGEQVQYFGHWHYLPNTLTVKLHTNGRYVCNNFITVDGDLFTCTKCIKGVQYSNHLPAVVKVLEPMDSTLNYFEYKIVSGDTCGIGIGVGSSDYCLDAMPGWDTNGIGYHADDGKLFHQNGQGKVFGPTCTVGDRMGCGVDFRSQEFSGQVNVFFTKNCQQVGDVVSFKIPKGGIYPLVGLVDHGEQVQYLGHWHHLPETLQDDVIGVRVLQVKVS